VASDRYAGRVAIVTAGGSMDEVEFRARQLGVELRRPRLEEG
jgi:hypothetical protein